MEVKVFKLKEIKLLSGDVVDVKKCCMVQPILPAYGKEGDACMDIYPICYEYDVFWQYRAWGDSIFFTAHLCWCRNLCFFYCGNRQYEASKNSCKHFSHCGFTLHKC